MGEVKYITSGGLAFFEKRDMKKLHRYSLKGWHVKDFTLMGYTLEKGNSSDYIYSVDYRKLDAEEEEEYLAFFQASGWSLVTSKGDIHLFRAPAGTKPIYTDNETAVEKYKNSSHSMRNIAILFLFINLFFWGVLMISAGAIHAVFLEITDILIVLAVPLVMTLVATYYNKWKIQGRKSLVHIVRATLIMLLFTAVFLLLWFLGVEDSLRIIMLMIAGGIAAPIAVWLFMTVYHMIIK